MFRLGRTHTHSAAFKVHVAPTQGQDFGRAPQAAEVRLGTGLQQLPDFRSPDPQVRTGQFAAVSTISSGPGGPDYVTMNREVIPDQFLTDTAPRNHT